MAAAVALRSDYASGQLRKLAKQSETLIRFGGCWLWQWSMTGFAQR